MPPPIQETMDISSHNINASNVQCHCEDDVDAHTGTSTNTDAPTEVQLPASDELDGHVYIDVQGIRQVYLWGDRTGRKAQQQQRRKLIKTLSRQVRHQNRWTPPPRPSKSSRRLTNTDFVPWLIDTLNAISTLAPATTSGPATPANIWKDTRNQALRCSFSTSRRPDFCLIPNTTPAHQRQLRRQVTWATVLVVGLHQSTAETQTQCLLQLAEYASVILVHQPLRWYVQGLLSYNKPPGGLRLVIFDRCGIIASRLLPIHLSTVTELATAYQDIPSAHLGFPSCPADMTTIPLPGGTRASIGKTLCRSPGIVGRATYCALAHSATGAELLVKYCWRSDALANEGDLLQLAAQRGVIAIAGHVSHEDVVDLAALRRGLVQSSGRAMDLVSRRNSDSRSHSTTTPSGCGSSANRRHSTTTPSGIMSLENRVYTRIVMTTIGTPISSLTEPLHIAQALLGGLIGHASLFFTGRILHRDISSNNILYSRKPLPITSTTNPLHHLHGFLIDLDHATVYPPSTPSGAPPGKRVGTLPFLSIGVLRNNKHTYRHDLESFLYVLLWVCIGGLPEWSDGTWQFIAEVKWRAMRNDVFFKALLERFKEPLRVSGLREVAKRWREVLFRSGKSMGMYTYKRPRLANPAMVELAMFVEMKEALERMVRGAGVGVEKA